MKKILASAAALGLLAGVATGASALELKASGKYQVDGFYINGGLGAAGGKGVSPWKDQDADDWWEHRMYVDADLIVNDKVKMKSQVRFIDKHSIWGSQDDGAITDGGGFEVKLMFLDYDSPIGKFQIGRRNAGAWGLDFVDSATHANRAFWYLPVPKPFQAYVFLQKDAEVDGYAAPAGSVNFEADDSDKDYYEAAFGYKNDAINALLGYGKTLDKSTSFDTQTTNAATGAVTTAYGKDVDMNRIKGFGTYKMGNFTLLGEFDWKFGTTDPNQAGKPDVDTDAWAYFLAGQAKFGNLTTTLAYAHIDGEDKGADTTAYDKVKGTGGDFEPLYILTGSACNILNGDRNSTTGVSAVGDAVRTAGVDALVLLADYKVSEPLTLHAGIGWGKADDTDTIGSSVDDDYGWEIDLGIAYQLYKNLTYEVHFGYWMVGDFAKLGKSSTETEDVMLLSHHLTMKF